MDDYSDMAESETAALEKRIAELERERDELRAVIAGVKLAPVGLQLVLATEAWRAEQRAAREAE